MDVGIVRKARRWEIYTFVQSSDLSSAFSVTRAHIQIHDVKAEAADRRQEAGHMPSWREGKKTYLAMATRFLL